MHVQPTTLWFRFSFDFFFIVVVVVAAVIVLFHVFRFCCYLFQTEYIFFSGSLGQRHASCLQIFIWPHSNYDAPVPYFARIFSPFVFSIPFHQHYYSILMVSLNGSTAYVLRLITYSLSARIYLAVILVVCVCVCWNSFRCRQFSSQNLLNDWCRCWSCILNNNNDSERKICAQQQEPPLTS